MSDYKQNRCLPGSFSLVDGAAACALCPAGTFSSIAGASYYSCEDCPAGMFSSLSGASECSTCSAGFISTLAASRECIPCPAGTYQPSTGSIDCLPCPNGTTNALIGQWSCSLCLPGRYPQTPTSGCFLCLPGTSSLTGDQSCSECASGLVALQAGSPGCFSCPFGQSAVSPSGPCLPCTQKGYFIDGVGKCQPCPAGTFSTGSGCVQCSAGQWSNLASIECSSCPLGMIGTNPASDLCHICPPGSVRFDRFQEGCATCLPGTFSSDPTLACVACIPGTSQPNAGKTKCDICPNGSVAPSNGTMSCNACSYGEYAISPIEPCQPCPSGSMSNSSMSLECSLCSPALLCPLASAFGVPSSVVPFFSQLNLPPARINAGFALPTFNSASLVATNYWTTTSGIVAITVCCGAFVLAGLVLILLYFAKRDTSASFATWKTSVAKADILFGASHVNGSTPKVVIERQTVFGAFMSMMVILGCCVLTALLVLNWYYSPTLNSSVVPFGYVGEPDPVATLAFHVDFWGWTGDCASACSRPLYSFSGIGLTSGTDWSIACTTHRFSCGIDISAGSVVVSAAGTIAFSMPTPGNAMGLTYSFSLTPSLNSSASSEAIIETIWAGPEEVLGGDNPVHVPISTTWTKVADNVRRTSQSGWLVSAAGSSTGSTLNNATYSTTTNKQVSMLVILQRGTTFLAITVSHGSSIAILIGSIMGYFVVVWLAGRIILRLVEWLHQHFHGVPTSVSEYLASLTPPAAMETGPKMEDIQMETFEDSYKTLAANNVLHGGAMFDVQFDENAVAIDSTQASQSETAVHSKLQSTDL